MKTRGNTETLGSRCLSEKHEYDLKHLKQKCHLAVGRRQDKASRDENSSAAPPCLVDCVGPTVDSPFGGPMVAQESCPGELSYLRSEE